MKQLRVGLMIVALMGVHKSVAVGFANVPCCEEEECKIVKAMACDVCACKVEARTHFAERPQFSWVSPERESLFRNRTRAKGDDGEGGAFQAVLFGGQSIDRGRFATYFTPFCTAELHVTEGQAGRETDVIADYFNVRTENGNFESIIRFAPRESTVGVGLTYQQRFCEKDNGKGYWIALSAPITRIRNTMGFSEEIINDGGGAASDLMPANMREAFSQESWCYGRIDCSEEKAITRLGDVEALFGYDIVRHEQCEMEGYLGFLIPTGNKVKSRHMFEPIVGHEKHGGVMFGTTAQIRLWTDETSFRTLDYHIHIHSLYLIPNIQTRLIPLQGKPWSQFMYVYKNQAEQQAALNATDTNEALAIGTPGVNVFAQNVKVSPGFQRALTTAIEYVRCDLTLEVGYNFFARPPECVELECDWQVGPALRAEARAGNVNSAILINQDYTPLENNNPAEFKNFQISECDLDLEAAAHPALISHTFYGSVGYKWDDECYPMFVGFGGSFEFTRDNTGTDRWTAWAKWGISW